MIEKAAIRLLSYLEDNKAIDPQIREAYYYGIQVMLVNLLSVSTALIIGLLLGAFWETAFFLLLFIPIRRFTGGLHAKTYLVCSLTTNSIVILTVLWYRYIPLTMGVCAAIVIMSGLVIGVFAPVENQNKALDQRQKTRCKIVSMIFWLVESLTGLMLMHQNIPAYKIVFISMLFVSFLILIAIFKEGRRTNEKAGEGDR